MKKNATQNDLVCGMDVRELKDLKTASYNKKRYAFCSDVCQKRFKKHPKKFLGEPLIKLREVKKDFHLGKTLTKVLRGVDLNIWEGDFISIIGASGSGKSTTLNMIGLLDRESSGTIHLSGEDVSRISEDRRAELRSKTFGFVFQQYNLIPWLNAFENTTLPLIFSEKNIDPSKIAKRFKDLGLGERMDHRPLELSGGEQQRVAIIRALSNDPDIVIADEPTGNLDSKTGQVILDLLIDLNKKHKKTLIIVTHDASIAEKADHIVLMKDGRVIRNHQSGRKIYTE